MTQTPRRRPRWLLPVGAATAVMGVTATFAVAASAETPAPTASELLTAVAQPNASALSGTVVTRGDLGLPAVPAGVADVGPFTLNDDEVTAQVWVDGETKQRITLGSASDEASVIRNGEETWLWSATDNRATLVRGEKGSTADEVPGTPAQMAEEILAKVEPSSDVAVRNGSQVAGRDVYDLVVTPKDDATLVARVVVAVDVETSVPLQVEVYSTQLTAPAYSSGFKDISFDAPPAAVFEFSAPEGAEVTQQEMRKPEADKPTSEAEVIGEGWSAVVVGNIDIQDLVAEAVQQQSTPADPELQRAATEAFTTFMTLPQLSGQWGSGRVVQGTLFSVLITDDGQYAAGAVEPETLAAALSKAAAE